LPLAGFEAAVCHLRKPESFAIEKRRLPGVANPELNMVNALQLERVFHPHVPNLCSHILMSEGPGSFRQKMIVVP
jgi:hypothetical protein